MEKNKKIAVLGAGSWGTAVSTLLVNNGYTVNLWCFEKEVVDDINQNRENKKYLPDVKLDEKIIPTSDIEKVIEGAEIIFEAVPVKFLRKVLEQSKPFAKKNQPWVLLSKGIEKESSLFPSQIIKDFFDSDFAVLSGPNFANQLASKEFTASIIASESLDLLQKIKKVCTSDYFKPFISSDVIGTQVGGALKNVISLFLGIVKGCGYKENTTAFLLTLGFDEIIKLTEFLGGKRETVCGLSGLGDLMLGLIGEKNRNYELGILLGQGKTLSELEKKYEIFPEGVNTIESIYQIIKKENLDLPVCSAAYQIVFQNLSIRRFVQNL